MCNKNNNNTSTHRNDMSICSGSWQLRRRYDNRMYIMCLVCCMLLYILQQQQKCAIRWSHKYQCQQALYILILYIIWHIYYEKISNRHALFYSGPTDITKHFEYNCICINIYIYWIGWILNIIQFYIRQQVESTATHECSCAWEETRVE